MRVSRSMLHPELRSFYYQGRFAAWMLKFKLFTRLYNLVISRTLAGKDIAGLVCDEMYIPGSDGKTQIRTRIYRPAQQEGPLPLLVYFHGGGYITGNPEGFGDIIKQFIDTRPCVVVAPDYRKAFTAPYPAGFNDCYDTLLWAAANPSALNILDEKIIVAGHSAGGGMTAAVTLKARDTGDVSIVFQMPIYPMIDDQQPEDPDRQIDTIVWSTDTNRAAWKAYLGNLYASGEDIPTYAAPSRESDLEGLPPTITFVGTLEPFYWETKAYVNGLKEAGIEVAYKEYENCFHGFDLFPDCGVIAKDALNFTYDTYAEFYDRYAI